MEFRRAARRIALAVALAVLPACLGPSLPLPPPTGAASYDLATSTTTVSGRANPGAYVFCLDDVTESGVLARANPTTGDYALTLPASAGDGLEVWQEIGTTTSGHLSVVVPGGPTAADH